ncbi:MAG: hypothetical protein M3348_11135 [Acidobacteriota bacterium]|nr:hypothetical protein [Acidobacteriota bacterium]
MLARLQAFRFSLFLALTAALCVVGNVALVSAQRTAQPSGRPVEATASSALAASTTIAPVSSAAFQETNGNKVVPGAGAIHAVFTDANSVKYTKTVDGVNWSPPVTIEANANHPTIAVAGTTIGIAYVASTGFIRYTYKSQTGTAWHAPINVYASGVSRDPTMVSYNSKMYLAWALSDTYVFYASFPPAITTAPTSQQANFSPLCFGYSSILFQPSIAVSATSATDPQPLIRVAYFKSETASSKPSPSSQTRPKADTLARRVLSSPRNSIRLPFP